MGQVYWRVSIAQSFPTLSHVGITVAEGNTGRRHACQKEGRQKRRRKLLLDRWKLLKKVVTRPDILKKKAGSSFEI